jgi:tRNA pseudouridine32 synthase/23S rRNA pseudouridine746 synthase
MSPHDHAGAPPRPATPPSRVFLPAGPWATLGEALCARFPAIDAATWAARCAAGRVLGADGLPRAFDAPHAPGPVTYWREVPDEPRIDGEVLLVHVDADWVVADKPHGLPVMPAGRFVRETLQQRLREALGEGAIAPLHRLDRGTAGLVLCARGPAAAGALTALFRERAIAKTYEAVAPPLPGRVFPLAHASRLVRGTPFHRMREEAGAPNATLELDVLERGARWWRYALRPVTGLKHQLRVQMAGLGAPLRHDDLYPEPRPALAGDPATPLQLLARRLAFVDPRDGTPRVFESARRLGPLD